MRTPYLENLIEDYIVLFKASIGLHNEAFQEKCHQITVQMQKNICKNFGLPYNKQNELLLVEAINCNICVEEAIDLLYNTIQVEATKYLLSPILTNSKLIKILQTQMVAANDGLALLQIENNTYTNFIYNEYLLPKKGATDQVWHALEIANTYIQKGNYFPNKWLEFTKYLQQNMLKHSIEFIQEYETYLLHITNRNFYRNGIASNDSLDAFELIEFDALNIHSVSINSTKENCVTATIFKNNQSYRICLLGTKNQIIQLLAGCKYYSDVADCLHQLKQNIQDKKNNFYFDFNKTKVEHLIVINQLIIAQKCTKTNRLTNFEVDYFLEIKTIEPLENEQLMDFQNILSCTSQQKTTLF